MAIQALFFRAAPVEDAIDIERNNADVVVALGLTVQRRYDEGFAVSFGIENHPQWYEGWHGTKSGVLLVE